MTLELHWLIFIILENELLTQEEVFALIETLGEDADFSTFAQEAYNLKAEDLDDEMAKVLLDNFEEAIELAEKMAESGEPVPELPEENIPEKDVTGNEADITQLSEVSDDEVLLLLKTMLANARENGASDLHISAGSPPFMRKTLQIQLVDENIISPEDAFKINTSILTPEQKEYFLKKKDLTVPFIADEVRYRATLMEHKNGVAGTFHLIPGKAMTLEQLGFMHDAVSTIEGFLDYHNGLILLAGPVGSGKTTTLAALVNSLNQKRKDHIITVEDPIEVVQNSINCNVTQREINTHTTSYAAAIKGALREDPDIIVIGELKDLETTEIAITASETGHLVIATLPTCDAINTLNRLVNVFPPNQQPQIRAMIAGSLRGVICQKLLPDINDKVTVAAEILVNNIAVSNNINEGKFFLLKPAMQVGKKAGMCIMDDYIFELFKNGTITGEVALENLVNIKQYEKMIKSASL